MIISFEDADTEAIFDGRQTKGTRAKCPQALWKIVRRKLDAFSSASRLEDLKSPGARLERLTGKRLGQHSIRINDRYRICFVWSQAGVEHVEITDYH
jgi:toxin HigB-1